MSLSDKIVHEEAIKAFIDVRSDKWIKMEDVKEFIKRLKEEDEKTWELFVKGIIDISNLRYILNKNKNDLAGRNF